MQLKIAVLGSEKTIYGFSVAGFSKADHVFLVFDEEINEEELTMSFQDILNRTDVGLVFITENLFDILANDVKKHNKLFPSILKIPTWL